MSVFPNNKVDTTIQALHAAMAWLEWFSKSIFCMSLQPSKTNTWSTDVIQNKEFFIIYTKVIH